jgi:ATPase family associated with various cellular activities (AAA)/ClpX C4-type zinc finger
MDDQPAVIQDIEDAVRTCSFCKKPSTEAKVLISGHGAFICDACARRCMDIVIHKGGGNQRRFIFELLDQHFGGAPPETITASSRHFPARMHADLQRALETSCLSRAMRVVGIHCERHDDVTFSMLLKQGDHAKRIAPLQYSQVDIGGGELVKCLINGLALLEIDSTPVAVVIAPHQDYIAQARSMNVEIAVPAGVDGVAIVDAIFNRLEEAIRAAQSYRGKILSLEQRNQYSGVASGITVHKLRTVTREQVILPRSTLDQLDSNVVKFAKLRERLRAMGMSTKKGLLFYGPPGTGKTHTIHYLAASLPHHTTLLVTAEQVGLLPEYFQLARLLQPAILVIEDVDLIARDRTTMDSACEEVMLNMLLNEMDGLREDADIFFVLTTNRPETIESALAARPGRIDQAIEFPLPDDQCRRRLVDLYRGNLELSAELGDEIVRRTDRVSASFIKELMRRIAQHHLDSGGAHVGGEQVDRALGEMLFAGGALNASLLGGARNNAGA